MSLIIRCQVDCLRSMKNVNFLPPAPRLPLGILSLPLAVLVIGQGLLMSGCASSPQRYPASHWIAVRYDVEPRTMGDFSSRAGIIQADFIQIAQLGFSGVILCHMEDGDHWTVLDLAAEAGLKAVIPDRTFDRFVGTGVLPTQCGNENELIRERLGPITDHAAFQGYALDHGRGSAAQDRARRVRLQLAGRGITCVSSNPFDAILSSKERAATKNDDDAPFAIIDARMVREGPPGAAVERLLAAYHAALCSGRTGGVMVDRYFRLPGEPPDLASQDEPLLPAHRSAISALVERARCWGPLLSDLHASSLASATDVSPAAITAFGRGFRRYVLIFNTSTDQFLREEIPLPPLVFDESAIRAVEVPPETGRGAGRVIHAGKGQLVIPIELRPSDAAMFEVFGFAQ